MHAYTPISQRRLESNCHRWHDWIVPSHCHQRAYYFKLAYKFKPGQMDLSHSGCHLPGRLAVLVLRDGDKTPVSSARIGGGFPSGRRGRDGGGRRTGAWGKLPWIAEMFRNNATPITHSLKWWWGAIQDSVGGSESHAVCRLREQQFQRWALVCYCLVEGCHDTGLWDFSMIFNTSNLRASVNRG